MTNALNQYEHTATAYTANSLNQYTATTNPSENLCYDADGNLVQEGKPTADCGTQDGTRKYTWDAENRLILVAPASSPVNGDKKVAFVYDYMGRRVRKTVSTYTGGAWVEDTAGDQLFVYDGWNVVMVLDANASNAVTKKYTWGLDLSGLAGVAQASLPASGIHAAGGIGGLLAVQEMSGEHAGSYWFLYDGNGNVGQVLKASDQSIAARYEYDPYGNTLVATGDYALANPFRFSTKWLDTETGLYYYGYRYYSPRMGRWMSRDPIQELRKRPDFGVTGVGLAHGGGIAGQDSITLGAADDGLAPYRYCRNAPITTIDPSGLESTSGCGKCGQEMGPQLVALSNAIRNIWGYKDPFILGSVCDNYRSSGGWDIAELAWGKHFFAAGGCGNGGCQGTVQVFGTCYAAHHVNYYLYGEVTRLCRRGDLWGAQRDVAVYRAGVSLWEKCTGTKTSMHDPDPYSVARKCRNAWVARGFYFNPQMADSDDAICQKRCCGKCLSTYTGTLTANLALDGGRVLEIVALPGGGATVRIIGG